MLGTLFQSSDVVSTALAVATVASFAGAALVCLGLTWTSDRWRIPVALSAVALLASGLQYLDASHVWLATQKMTAAYRFVGWFVITPLQVAAAYFFARTGGEVPAGVFWRTLAAAVLPVLCRYLGDARIFDPTLGILLPILFWLFVLGEMYFGRMAEAVRKSSRPIRLGYFWIRLILTICRPVVPILCFLDAAIGAVHTPSNAVAHTNTCTANIMTPSFIVLA